MSESKHTPGPWEVHDNNEGSVFILMGSALKGRIRHQCQHSITVCEELEDGPQLAEAFANARLMAKSPALLSICEELLESAEYWSEYFVPLGIVDRLRDAVRDAKGEKQ